jgi:allantoinase
MASRPLFIRTRRLVDPAGVHPGSVLIRDGLIVAIDGPDAGVPADTERLDVGELAVSAGLVDTHVHINEPGRTAWEGFETATRAAAAGGITTLVDMPLNCVPATTTVDGLEAKRQAAEGKCCVDVGFWGGVVPGNTTELAPLVGAGVLGFKCFLVPSGVDEFPNVGAAELAEAMRAIEGLGVPLLVHAELPGPIDAAAAVRRTTGLGGPMTRYADYLASRPEAAEHDAVRLVIDLSRETGVPVHIVHVSSGGTCALLEAARAERLPVTAETCPHYLCLSAGEIPDGATEFKCAPPVRTTDHQMALWSALATGCLDFIVSDHSPSPPAMKCRDTGDFARAWGGIASLELGLPLVWTAAARRGHGIEIVARWMTGAPARLAGLARRKGRLAVGFDADLVVWDPEASFEVRGARLQHRHPLTPYEGRRLSGVVERTIVRGETVYDRGRFPAGSIGRLLRRDDRPGR